MKWEAPPLIKIYEALGAVADKRVEVSGTTARIYSSSRNKFYSVEYDPGKAAIMANDNGSYWKGYLGYPAIAFLMASGIVSYNEMLGALLKGIAWKDVNTKFKNDFDKTLEFILKDFSAKDREALDSYALKVQAEIAALGLSLLGKKTLPPAGY